MSDDVLPGGGIELTALDLAFPAPREPATPRVAFWDEVESPVGRLFVATGEDGRVRRIKFRPYAETFVDELLANGWLPIADRARNDALRRQLDEFFEGRRRSFELDVDLGRMPPFHRAVLEACAQVPYGGWETYGSLALMVGNPRAARAVGNALNANPVPLVVPCHRVLAAGGKLGGYGGGLDVKRYLLTLEGLRPR